MRGVQKIVATDDALSFDHTTVGLTEREWAVVKLMAQGMTNPQIAAALDLTKQTVRNKVTKIYTKVGVASRPAFLLWAQEQGIRAMG